MGESLLPLPRRHPHGQHGEDAAPATHGAAHGRAACGVQGPVAWGLVLPEPDERNLLYANQVTSGVECLPCYA